MRPWSTFQQGRGAWDGEPAWGGWHSEQCAGVPAWMGRHPRVAVAVAGGDGGKACLLHSPEGVWVGF